MLRKRPFGVTRGAADEKKDKNKMLVILKWTSDVFRHTPLKKQGGHKLIMNLT